MAKQIKFNGGTKLAGFILAVTTVIVSITLAWSDQKGATLLLDNKVDSFITQQTKERIELKKDGCDPAGMNTTSVAVIKSQLTDIKLQLTDIEKKREADTNALMEAIGKMK